ncbi:glycoside hydrolase family 2 protein [Saccharopolyspora rosea]|uniref:Glycoside hydrolase family 2 TIM barrel-domain containing protein n=1 Tax=Saccharopolyspora rosea TaxID=524884 RepID=A0ABW3FZX2_9PSEU|nr:glycoside hydrolase family 2 TIM barrel-domain containing protein [Saccharopolyspora rosea]
MLESVRSRSIWAADEALPEGTGEVSRGRFSRRVLWRATALTAAVLAFHRTAPATAAGPAELREPLLRDWLFAPLDGARPGAVADRDMSTVDLPHTATGLSWRRWDPASWQRRWLYRKHFPARVDPGLRYFLHFDAALTDAAPVLNGTPLPAHAGGYLPFRPEVTGLLAGHNTLDVVVDGSFDPGVPPNRDGAPESVDFWQPAGLYREVHLVGVPAAHVADVFAKPVGVLDDASRRLEVRCELDLAEDAVGLRVDAELRRAGTTLAAASTGLPALPPGRHPVALRLPGPRDVALWGIETPELYDVVVTLSQHGRALHDHRVRTGFREARFTRSGFFLNGERVQLFGLNRHQFFPFAGAAMPARVQRRDAQILREELNCNAVRCSHYPQHEAFLDACDELGLLVWEEPPGWQHLGDAGWLDRAYRDVHDMIVRDRNHPCVVLWAARLNETPGAPEFYARTQRLAEALDDSRQTTGAVHPGDHDTTDFQQDVFGYDDYTAGTGPDGRPRPELLPPRTDRPYLVSEAVGTLSGPARYYRRTDPQPVQQGQALAHARAHDLARSDERYAGLLGWAGFDYPSGQGNSADGIKWPGVVDLFRVAKPGAAVYRAQVDPRRRPVLEPAFCWVLDGPSPVGDLGDRAAIFSNADRLELHVDGRHLAALRPDRAEFPRLPHPPFFADLSTVDGVELRIDGYLGDRLVISRRFCADRSRDRLALALDDAELSGVDATRAEIRAVDRFGNTRPHVTGDVALEVAGPAVLVGDNPFPLADTGGAGAVWLRSCGAPGVVRLRARHDVLGSAAVELRVG